MKIIGLIILGLIASAIIQVFFIFGVLKMFPTIRGDSYMWIPIFITYPISLFVGSSITGYFSYYELENRWSLFWIAPALYANLLLIGIAVLEFPMDSFMGANQNKISIINGILLPIAVAIYWYLASLGGVASGYSLRNKIARWYMGINWPPINGRRK